MTDTYYTTHTKRHWYQWPVVIIASGIMWAALGAFMGMWKICDRICGE